MIFDFFFLVEILLKLIERPKTFTKHLNLHLINVMQNVFFMLSLTIRNLQVFSLFYVDKHFVIYLIKVFSSKVLCSKYKQ